MKKDHKEINKSKILKITINKKFQQTKVVQDHLILRNKIMHQRTKE